MTTEYLNFEWADFYQAAKINEEYRKACRFYRNGYLTIKECEYTFITNLQKLECLTEKDVFNVYTNVTIK